ncbi:AAA family ATPase [Candidatus Woesearchaeota archaeon]|nr:AAA family ATPase [Candidatus Woesearchaeota archaeon]
MRIIFVELENIRSYEKATLCFPKGSVLLSGDIGAGKSTLLYAVEFALFGLLRGELSGSMLLRHGAQKGSVKLAFEINQKEYIIHRTLKRIKNRIEQDEGSLVVHGLKQHATATELKTQIIDLLGYPKNLLTKNKNLIYRYTVYTPQEEMKRIIYEDAETRIMILRKVFDLEKYKHIQDNSLIMLRWVKEQQKILEGMLQNEQEKKQQQEATNKLLKEAQENYALIIPELQKMQQVLEAQKKEVQKYELLIKSLHEKKQEYSAITAFISSKKEQQKNLQQEKERIKKISEQLTTDITKPLESKEAIQQKITDLENHIQEKYSLIHEQLQIRATQATLQEQSNAVLKKLESLSLCPLCLQNVPHEHKINIQQKEQQNIGQCNKLIHQSNEKANVLKSERELLQQQQKQAQNSLQTLMVYELKQKHLFESEERLKQLQQQEKDLQEQIISLEKNKTALELIIKESENLEKQYREQKQKVDDAQNNYQNILVQSTKAQGQVKTYQQQLKIIEEELEKKKIFRKKLEQYQHLSHWMQNHFIPLIETVEKHMMATIHLTFNEVFQKWFSMLVDDEYMTARLDDVFTPIIEQNGHETEVNSLSGGERTACALAYRLALNTVINDLLNTIQTKKLLILDEPTDGFSSQQLDKLRDVLQELNMQQLIMVSHESKVESFVDHVIKVHKDHTSRVFS